LLGSYKLVKSLFTFKEYSRGGFLPKGFLRILRLFGPNGLVGNFQFLGEGREILRGF